MSIEWAMAVRNWRSSSAGWGWPTPAPRLKAISSKPPWWPSTTVRSGFSRRLSTALEGIPWAASSSPASRAATIASGLAKKRKITVSTAIGAPQ